MDSIVLSAHELEWFSCDRLGARYESSVRSERKVLANSIGEIQTVLLEVDIIEYLHCSVRLLGYTPHCC